VTSAGFADEEWEAARRRGREERKSKHDSEMGMLLKDGFE
jgi:hypothetical protein